MLGPLKPRRLNELVLGADALEEQDELKFEKDHGVDRGTTALGIAFADPLADEAQVELRFKVAVEVILGNEVLQRDGNRVIKAAGLGRAEHHDLS